MHIIKQKTLKEFWSIHNDVENQLKSWIFNIENSTWKSFNDVKQIYRSADLLKDNRIVFNIKGNDYRLIVKVNFDRGQVYIKFIGTHSEYDKIDANTVDMY
ncbi:MAG: addiction module toxin RelE [Bacteroidetes bacterium GWA2_31_9]|nr:MAG: addiction module toxin RelE [Bacteroidetes bacterium GWA2_31_9]